MALAAITLLAACSKPQNTVLPTDVSKWGDEVKASIQKLSEEDQTLFFGYATRNAMDAAFGGKGIPPGTTIGAAIADQKQWIAARDKANAEQQALKEKMLAEQEAFRKQVAGAVTVTVIEKKLLPINYEARRFSEEQFFKLGFENKSGKDIAGIQGEVTFIDIFDKEVGSFTFSYDHGIKAGEIATWEGARQYNQFLPEHQALANLESGKYTTKFKPEMIVFSDGTKMRVSQ